MLIQGLKKEKKTFSKRIHKKLPQYEAVLTNLFPSKETIEFLLPSSGRWTSHSRSGKISLWMGWWWRRERLVTPHSNRRRRGIFLHVRNECMFFFLLSRFLPYNFTYKCDNGFDTSIFRKGACVIEQDGRKIFVRKL